jgi:hypothetical protein
MILGDVERMRCSPRARSAIVDGGPESLSAYRTFCNVYKHVLADVVDMSDTVGGRVRSRAAMLKFDGGRTQEPQRATHVVILL